ncbi:hypothetical protein ACFFQF_22060 [Haladaptatus pallidirubidus]
MLGDDIGRVLLVSQEYRRSLQPVFSVSGRWSVISEIVNWRTTDKKG